MSRNELDRLIADMREDPALARRLAGDGELSGAAGRARAAGYDVTPEECGTALAPDASGELSDADLGQVAGGSLWQDIKDGVHDVGKVIDDGCKLVGDATNEAGKLASDVFGGSNSVGHLMKNTADGLSSDFS